MRHIYLLLCVSLFLLSCRVEESFMEYNNQQESVKKFITFTKNYENEEIDYAKGFKELALRYDSLHRRNITGRDGIDRLLDKLKLSRKVPFSELKDIEYIDFSIRTELVEEENGDKWVLYPRIQGGKVKNLVSAVLSEDETKLGYYTLDYPNALYIANIELFREAYERAKSERGSVDGYITYDGICGISNRADCVIKEIIIRPVRGKPDYDGGGRGSGGSYYGGDSGGGGEGCSPYEACSPGNSDDGGYPYPPNNDKNTDPCKNVKQHILSNPKIKEPLKELKEKSKIKGEKGFKIKPDGTISDIIDGKEYSVDLGNFNGYVGAYHNHTPTGIKIHSIPDIFVLFKQIVFRDKNVSVSSVFSGMIGTEACPSCPEGYKTYNYVIRFKGSEEEAQQLLNKYEYYDFTEDVQWYRHYAYRLSENNLYRDEQVGYLNTAGLEKLFFASVKHMNLDANKLLLQKIDENGNITNITMENNASLFPDYTVCN